MSTVSTPDLSFAPTDEQAQLCDMIARFFREKAGDFAPGRGPLPDSHWRELARLGLPALLLPERAGGLGGGHHDAALVAEEFGRALAISPLAEGLVGAAGLVALYGDADAIDRWIAPVLAGEGTLALAAGPVSVSRDDRLTGSIAFVGWAPGASAIVVATGDAAHLVDARSPGVALEAGALIDGTPVATVRLEAAHAERIVLPAGALDRARARVQLCYVAEMVGAMAMLHGQTVSYAQQRRQFGAPIASFQAVQHKLARMFVALEQSRSMLARATLCREADPGFVRAVTAAKAYVAEAARRLAEDAVQLHGGIGVTDELVVGRGLRRVSVLARLFGGAGDARAQLAA